MFAGAALGACAVCHYYLLNLSPFHLFTFFFFQFFQISSFQLALSRILSPLNRELQRTTTCHTFLSSLIRLVSLLLQ